MLRPLVLSALIVMTGVSAQELKLYNNCVSEPEFAEVFFRLDGCKLISLERAAPAMHHQIRGFIVLSTKTSYELPGAKSPIRFSTGQQLDFVVRSPMAASRVDPSIAYSLRALNSNKNTRELVRDEGRVSPVGATIRMKTGDTLPVEFSKYGESSFRVTTPELARGEYTIGRASGLVMFCFGVD